jgi:hypothetical protein
MGSFLKTVVLVTNKSGVGVLDSDCETGRRLVNLVLEKVTVPAPISSMVRIYY